MNYLFIHVSPEDAKIKNPTKFTFNWIPDYYFHQMIHTCKIDKNATVDIICNNKNISDKSKELISNIKNIHIIDVKQYLDDEISKEITEYGSSCYDLDKICLYKFPFMLKYIKDNNLSEAFYQEADVPIYEPFDNVRKYFISPYITTCGYSLNNKALLTGIFYSCNVDELQNASLFIVNSLKKGIRLSDWSAICMYYQATKKINILPSLPEETDEYIFDPNSWGQFLGGDNREKTPGFIDRDHRIAQKFLIHNKGRFNIYRDTDGIFKLNFNDKTYKFYNLHIHNKDAISSFI